MALPPPKRVELGHFTRFWGRNNYPQWSGTRPHKAFQPSHTWAHNALAVELFTGQLEQQCRFIVFERACQQPRLQGIHIHGRSRTKSHIGPHMPAMLALGPPIVVEAKHPRGDAELFSDKRHYDLW